MMHVILLAMVLLIQFAAAAQTNKCKRTYYKNSKKMASEHCYDADERWGVARAYDQQGNVIYEKNLRKIAGHSSVSFDYYPNGAVRRAEWSDAPDAGIQWYRSITTFDERGKVINESKTGWDERPSTYLKREQETVTTPQPTIPKQETVTCAVLYKNEMWVNNTTPYNVTITTTRKGQPTETQQTLVPSKTSKQVGTLILAQQHDEPSKYYELKASTNNKKVRIKVLAAEKEPLSVNTETTRYYYELWKAQY